MAPRFFSIVRPLAAVLAWSLINGGASLALDEVKVHTSGSTSANVLIYKIAQEQGFYKEENLNVLTIAATSQAGIQGLVGGSFDFSQILGQTSAAILHGAPLKNVMVFDTKPLFWFFGGKKIRRVQDLKGGKLIGVSSLGANTDQMTREILAMNGIDPRKDVVIQGTGTGAVRLAALIGGSLDAAITNPTESIVARKQGLNELFFYGDYDLNIVSGGTDNHLMLVDLSPKEVTGKAAEVGLDRAFLSGMDGASLVGTLQHFSTWRYGSNFFFADVSGGPDLEVADTDLGVYLIWDRQRQFLTSGDTAATAAAAPAPAAEWKASGAKGHFTLSSLTGAPLAAQILKQKWVRPNKRIFDNSKISDHFAIIPTLQTPRSLNEAEQKLYDLVVRRFLAVFFPSAEYLVTTRITQAVGHHFKTEGKVLVKPGWLAIYGKEAADQDPDAKEGDKGQNLVPVKPGEMVRSETVEAKGLKTRPPARSGSAINR